MMNVDSDPVYQSSQSMKVNLTAPLPDEFYGLSPDELESEYVRYTLLLEDALASELIPEEQRVKDAEYFLAKLQRIERRREQYRKSAYRKYPWPDRERFNHLKELAADMKRRMPLERFIATHVPQTQLERSGALWIGNCPIPTHDDHSPSFTVYDDDHFHCYGCGKHGDIYELIGLVFGLERFPDRVEFLAEVLA